MGSQQHSELLGLGIYTLQEASLYGSLSSNKLSRWVFGTRAYDPVIESPLAKKRLISFYDLIQSMAIDRARKHNIPLPKIRQAINTAQKYYNVKFPLAYDHKLIWFDRELHIEFPNKPITQVSGRLRGQTAIKKIIEPFMEDLHFNKEGLVEMFVPFKNLGRQIVLDPTRQFGQPLVGKTGYRADVLDRAFAAEQSEELVADSFGIEIEDVKAAAAYMRHIREAA